MIHISDVIFLPHTDQGDDLFTLKSLTVFQSITKKVGLQIQLYYEFTRIYGTVLKIVAPGNNDCYYFHI